MAATGEIRAGKAYVELFLKDKLGAGIKKAGQKLSTFGKTIMAAGAAITAPLTAASIAAARSGSALLDMSKRTGISVERLSTLGYAASQTGASIDDVERAVKLMQKTIAGIPDEVEGTTGSLEALALRADELRGLSPEQQFDRIASAIARIGDPTERAAAALKVFGKSGTMMLPMIEDLAKLEQAAKRLGLVRTTEWAKKMDALDDAMTDVHYSTQTIVAEIGGALAPLLTRAAGTIARVAASTGRWVKENGGLIVTVFKIAAGAVALGAALFVLGKAIAGVGVAFAVMSKIVGVSVAIFGTFASPIGAVVILLAGLGAYFLFATESGARALQWLGERFGDLKTTAVEVFGGIADALMAGDVLLAGQILWLGLRIIFRQGWEAIKGMFDTGTTAMSKWWSDLMLGMSSAWSLTTNALATLWIETIAFLRTAWARFAAWYDNLIADTGDKAVEMLIKAKIKTGAITEKEGKAQLDYLAQMRTTDADRRAKESTERENKIEQDRLAARKASDAKLQAELIAAVDANQQRKATMGGNATPADEKELEQLKAKLAELRKKAADEKRGADLPEMPAMPAMPSLGDAAMMSGQQTRGTFNVAGIQGLQSDGSIKKVADNTAKANTYLDDINRALSGKGVFAP